MYIMFSTPLILSSRGWITAFVTASAQPPFGPPPGFGPGGPGGDRGAKMIEMLQKALEMTPEQAKTYPGKSLITRAIGTENLVYCDIFHKKVTKGDYFLLCTDEFVKDLDQGMETVADFISSHFSQ